MKEILSTLNHKRLNEKTNHYIFANIPKEMIHEIVSGIQPICTISDPTEEVKREIGRSNLINVIVDISSIKIDDFLNETLFFLQIAKSLSFHDKTSLLRFRGILRECGVAIQWIILKGDVLSFQDQMRLNEIFWFNTYFFNINYLLTSSDLKTYCLENGRYLDPRENYQKIMIPQVKK